MMIVLLFSVALRRERATVAAISRVISVPYSAREEQCGPDPTSKTKRSIAMSGTIIKSARNTSNAPQDLGPYTQGKCEQVSHEQKMKILVI
ncbi:hypothetical protein [Aeromonas caviae]|uniref:hypothetical protein n=1 Tax=Aeromonas caviae TaxID=648 RepID=UPI002B48E1F0|nr:hypothetical protein [Aeromonas caviae]